MKELKSFREAYKASIYTYGFFKCVWKESDK